MESKSSSSNMAWRYDVFVSFRGEDIRYTFADHLFAAFQKKDIVAFRDDTNLKQGDHISAELVQAIQGSRVLIVVFSKNYATSTWCLEELAQFVDCCITAKTGQTLLPVFYDVTPSEVRKQSGEYYGKAFAELEQRFGDNLETVQRWRKALKEVADISGWEVQNKPQDREIGKIVKRVISIVGYKLSSSGDLVGMKSRVEKIEKLLDLDSNDVVRAVGIHGMGGIGKTTLARAVYDKNLRHYDAPCYIDDVSKVYHDFGTIGVQKQLVCQALKEEKRDLWNISEATHFINTRLRHVKSFIVLDNVDKDEQLKKLSVIPGCLLPGSRVIVVSRDRQILRNYGVDEVYEAEQMNEDEAYELFCRKAFKSGHIMSCDHTSREYEVLTNLALKYAQGLPLAIEVLGSFLFGKKICEWKSALDRLEDSPSKDIMDVLQISFEGLDRFEKEIFLDIACLFIIHSGKEYVERVLDYCEFYPIIGISVLVDKSLITIRNSSIIMHDKLRELGMKIVRQKAPNEPGKWSRLWLVKDFHNLMYSNMTMDNLEAIALSPLPPLPRRREQTTLRAEALSKMNRLRYISIDDFSFSGSLNCLSNELRYLDWNGYPFTYFPSSCELNKLVELHLPSSSIKQLWEGTKPMYKLKVVILRGSTNLVKTPDFGGAPNLEHLDLCGCTELVDIHPSIGDLRKLVYLDLQGCTSLTSLSNNISRVNSLQVVILNGCSKLFHSKAQANARHGISDTATPSIYKRLKLTVSSHFLRYRRQDDEVDSLKPSSLSRLQCLVMLDLSYCNLVNIPDVMAELYCLEILDLAGNEFVTLPSFIMELPRLIWLKLDHCKELTSLSKFPLHTALPTQINLVRRGRGREAGLRMFNCPKSVEMGRSWISIAFSWMMQFLKVHKESSPDITIVISGTDEIPSWFNRQSQSVGDSISLEPIPRVEDSNWVGVAFCAAFVAQFHPPTTSDHAASTIFCRCLRGTISWRHLVAEVKERDGVTGELVHLCLVYFTRKELISFPIRRGILDDVDVFHFELFSDDKYVSVEVKHWGARTVYKQDLEELNALHTYHPQLLAP